MLHLPAAASPAILFFLVVTLGYLLTCAVWPFGPCRRCEGLGKHRSSLGRMYRICRRCQGTGLRLRTGRRVWNYLARLNRDMHR